MTIPDLPPAERRTHELVRGTPAGGGGPLDLGALFGNDRPVELEVGVGKGRFIMLAAVAKPETNFIGVEYARKFLERAIDRVGKRGVENVRLFHAEAVSFFADRLADHSVSAAHFYFPDPWPKKRHHKRRFFRTEALDQLARVLLPGALFRSVTDHGEYAEVIREIVGSHAAFKGEPDDDRLWKLPGMGEYTALGVTNFEIKYRREGRDLQRFAWRRI
jgi:tRNA (guanine-N7-)-methyltransferase